MNISIQEAGLEGTQFRCQVETIFTALDALADANVGMIPIFILQESKNFSILQGNEIKKRFYSIVDRGVTGVQLVFAFFIFIFLNTVIFIQDGDFKLIFDLSC